MAIIIYLWQHLENDLRFRSEMKGRIRGQRLFSWVPQSPCLLPRLLGLLRKLKQPACLIFLKCASHALTKTLLYMIWSWMLLWIAVSVSECPRNNSCLLVIDALACRVAFWHSPLCRLYSNPGKVLAGISIDFITNYLLSLGIIILKNNSTRKYKQNFWVQKFTEWLATLLWSLLPVLGSSNHHSLFRRDIGQSPPSTGHPTTDHHHYTAGHPTADHSHSTGHPAADLHYANSHQHTFPPPTPPGHDENGQYYMLNGRREPGSGPGHHAGSSATPRKISPQARGGKLDSFHLKLKFR